MDLEEKSLYLIRNISRMISHWITMFSWTYFLMIWLWLSRIKRYYHNSNNFYNISLNQFQIQDRYFLSSIITRFIWRSYIIIFFQESLTVGLQEVRRESREEHQCHVLTYWFKMNWSTQKLSKNYNSRNPKS